MSGFCFHLMAGMYGTSTSINWILMGKWHLQRTHEFYDKMSYKSIQITPTHNWANIPRKKACRVSKHPKIILSYSTYIVVCFSKKEGKVVAWWIGAGARIGEAWARSNELWSCWFILLARVFLSCYRSDVPRPTRPSFWKCDVWRTPEHDFLFTRSI